jgi:hypothetical protein
MRSGFATNFGAFQIVRPSLILKNPSNTLIHGSGTVPMWETVKKLANSYITVTIMNPYGPPKYWSYGLQFRADAGMGYIVFNSITNAAYNWDFSYRWDRLGPWTESVITSGTASNLKLSAGDSNKLGLMVVDDVGVLYLNDQKVSELDLSSITGTGKSGVSAGWFVGDEWEPEGAGTEFEDLHVWSLGD